MQDKTAAIEQNFTNQAGWCERLGSPFSARLLEHCAKDFRYGGIVHDITEDWSGAAHMDAVGLRLIGALHYAAMTGLDEALAASYPAGTDDWDIQRVWGAAESFMIRKPDWVRVFMQQAPQTNETRRSVMFLSGFLHLARRFNMPMHVLELGASAGLNTIWDGFYYATESWAWGAPSPVTVSTHWKGPPPALDAQPVVASRASCDRNPLNLADADTRSRVRSYIWADQAERLARFDHAADLAVERNVRVDRADAEDWLADKLAIRPKDALTVVCHSVFFQYPPQEVRRMIRDLIESSGRSATANAPLAWMRFEPEGLFGGPKGSMWMNLDIRTWPGDETRILARSDGHVTKVEAFEAIAGA